MFTLVISTYNRDNILLNHLSHWTTCINIYEIHVVFHNPNKIIPKQLTKLAKKYNIIIRQQESNKISNRFNVPDNGFKTDAVFSVDDDFVIDCDLVNTAYEYWSNTVDPSTSPCCVPNPDRPAEVVGSRTWAHGKSGVAICVLSAL